MTPKTPKSSAQVCPACAHDMCEDCTGAGCYCDCQVPREELEDNYDAELDEEGRINGYY